MSDIRKAKVLLTAVYKSGEALKQDYATPARVAVLDIPGASKYRELSIRLVVDTKDAEELLEGLTRGTVSLSIEQMLSAVERESSSS